MSSSSPPAPTPAPDPSPLINVPKWINDNKKFFLPPVCNKMMHGAGQLKVFYVGGPNIRKDFHLEEGEELFFQESGDMVLRCLVQGKFKDVSIKEGEVFLLPGMIPHSPQRYKDTVGLVIERERRKSELDCLRYFVEDSTETLWEKWFYCEDLGTQLGPVIKEYFASQQHKSGQPIPGTITDSPPWIPDSKRALEEPFLLSTWLTKNKLKIKENGNVRLFDTSYQSDVTVMGSTNDDVIKRAEAQIWLYQLEGISDVILPDQKISLVEKDSLLIEKDTEVSVRPSVGGYVLQVIMDPTLKSRGFKHLTK